MEVTFWILVFIIFYTYIGYGILLYFMVLIKRLTKGKTQKTANLEYEPDVVLMIPAYNEQDYIEEKITNSLELDYPSYKLQIVCVTDGSDDRTVELLGNFKGVVNLHKDERKGKIAAMNRGMQNIDAPLVIFTDSNTTLPKNTIRDIVAVFADSNVGCVAGEKRIFSQKSEAASTAGEGIYWKYESFLKKLDSELTSVVGAAGELFAIRTALFEDMETDTILDDFMLSLRIAMKGYRVVYCPEAYAIESASATVKEEMKRKIRISAGGIQSISRLLPLLNIFKYGMLSFQYISHRVLRWTITPLCLLFVLVVNLILIIQHTNPPNKFLYEVIFISQIVFYLLALLGWFTENKKIRFKIFFIPFYFFVMNLATYLGFYRIITGKQSSIWERAKRKGNE